MAKHDRKMVLRKLRSYPHLWTVENKEDMPMFLHCSVESSAVTERFLRETVIPTLNVYGVTVVLFSEGVTDAS